jgi:16S rRNA (cytosine967-C5)-methyltransferase
LNQGKSNPPEKISPARRVAHHVLKLVSGGGFATDLLLEHSARLSARDAGLASQIVYGCLRFQGQLDFLIRRSSGRKLEDLDASVHLLLRMGIFQLRYLDRIPKHAAVNETVELAKRHRRSAAGLVNAVLRKVDRQPVKWPSKAVELSCPGWLLERWVGYFGEEIANGIAKTALKEPERFVRIPLGGDCPGPELQATDIPGCYRVTSNTSTGFRLQDIGSQAVVPFLELRAGQSFLDLCAAPGNKTAQALETEVLGVAADISHRRLQEVSPSAHRVVLDASRPLPFRKTFDRILVDAPCSGTGTLARNPEIKWRLKPADLVPFHNRQVRILKSALAHLAPGGRLIYSTCSLEVEENEEVLRAVLIDHGAARLARQEWRVPGQSSGDGFFIAVILSDR